MEKTKDEIEVKACPAPICSVLAGARYRSSYMDGGKKTWTPWKTVGDHWGIAKNHFSELSEVWTKDTEWDFSGVLSRSLDVPFPNGEEAREILAREGIDTTDLIKRCMKMICEKTGHRWELSWPLDPCEYTCTRCGKKVLH